MRVIFSLFISGFLAACEAADMESAKREAAAIGGEALEAATGVVDTRTACVLAGQSEAFCGCVQERLGPRLRPEHLENLINVTMRATNAQGVEEAAREASNIDPATRDALVACAAHTTIESVLGGPEN